jgi:D-arabinose 1-dehydrogenase-like Zn-dependent alcohol dehydrogenase
LITGAGGGAALLGAQMALAAGAEVAFTTGSEAKADQLRKLLPGLGASAVYKNPSWHKDLAKTAGTFDLILDSAGGEDFSRLVDLASPGGKIAFFGATHGNPSAFPLAKVFWKQLSILGSTMGSEADFQTFISFVNQHRIVPVVDQVFPFQDIQKAFNRMESGSQTGKIVIKIRN